MTDIRDRLRDADPLLLDPALSRDDVARMRRTVVDAAQGPRDRAGLHWGKMLPIAAAVALIAAAGVDAARRASRQTAIPVPRMSSPAPAAATKTQLHFSTPGGTRI